MGTCTVNITTKGSITLAIFSPIVEKGKTPQPSYVFSVRIEEVKNHFNDYHPFRSKALKVNRDFRHGSNNTFDYTRWDLSFSSYLIAHRAIS